MEPEAFNTESVAKLLASRSIKIRIAFASAVILVAGALLAPRPSDTALSVPPELPAPLIEEQVQQRPQARPFRGVQEVAALAVAHSVAIPRGDPQPLATRNDFLPTGALTRPAGFGVFVSDTHVLTHEQALDGRSSTQLSAADDRSLEAQVTAYEPSTGLVLLQTGATGRPLATIASAPPPAGTLAVAVGRWDGRDIAIPVFVTSVAGDRYRVGAIDDALLAGMPLFTLDGVLFAIAAGDGRNGDAFALPQAAIRLSARASSGEPQGSVGIALQDRSSRLATAFGDEGVVVSDVIEGGPADVAGVQAGDVLLAVGGEGVGSADDATRALGARAVGSTTPLRLRRSRTVRTVDVTPAPAYEVAALARAAVHPSGPEARELFDPDVLGRAGVPATSRVLSVNGRPPSSRARIERELRRSPQPALVLVRHGNSQFFTMIELAR